MLLFIIIAVIVIYIALKASKNGKCIKCGNETSGLSGVSLNDGSMICNNCFARVPKYFKEYALSNWKSNDFDDFLKYLDYSNDKLLPIFEHTGSYGDLYIDENHGLFYASHKIFGAGKPEIDQPIFEFKDLKAIDFNFEPEKLKEGIFGAKVKGNVYFVYEMGNINIAESTIIQYDESARAEQNFFKTKITYGLPEDLQNFEMKFVATYLKFKPVDISSNQGNNEVTEALNIFMFDSLDELTQDKLKEQRNRLIKAFHPDENGEIDSKYAAKINNAFKILDEKCPSNAT